MLRDTLAHIADRYPTAKTESFTGHAVAIFIRNQFREEIQQALGPLGASLLVVGSAGQSDWADVPWGAVYDTLITDTATRGFYVVYLFSAAEPIVFLSLNQGTTAVKKEFGSRHREVLRDRAALMRARLPELIGSFNVTEIQLGSPLSLPRGYEAGHAMGKKYDCGELPTEEVLRSDLQQLVRGYSALIYRGGLDPSAEAGSSDDAPREGATLAETRQYSLHRRIDRHPKASKEAKRFHGTTCQACQLSFAERYGPLGDGFIEAHHLKPLAALEEGKPFEYVVATDFAVLCSNCHRMIHRTEDPSDLDAFKRLLRR